MAENRENVEMEEKEETVDAEKAENEPEKTKDKRQEKRYSDEEVDAIIDKKFAEWSAKKEAEIEEAKLKESMNAKERAEYEAKLKDNEIADLKRKIEKAKIKETATDRLTDKKLPVTAEVIDIVLKETEMDTIKAVDAFADLVEQTVADELKKNARQSTPASGNARKPASGHAPDMKEFAEKNRLIKE